MKRSKNLLPMFLLAASIGVSGCASQQTQTTETTSTMQPVETSQTTTTTKDSGHSSVVGATANLVWTVVTFPFRVVGDVISEIV